MKARCVATVAVAAAILFCMPAAAGAATVQVDANGNAFTGGLSFTPTAATARVGDTVQWTNTDFVVPHTATEDHGLFDLGGTYGATPVSPAGFAPGTSAQWSAVAGTFSYYCRVHPTQMNGVVAVAPAVRVRPRRRRAFASVRVTLAPPGTPADYRFDVQKSTDGGPFHTLWEAIAGHITRFSAAPGKTIAFRSRVRSAANPSAVSDWSPATSVSVR